VGAVGGTGPYTYDWYDVAGAPTTPTVNSLPADTFHVAVTDNNGCIDTAQVIIEEPAQLVLTMDSTQTTCVGLSDGTASVAVTGGVGPYSYNWYNAPGSPTTDSITGLSVGTYFVEVTDSNGCIDTNSVQVTAPVTVTSSIADSTNLTCYSNCIGTARVVPVGGAGGYTYDWFNVPGGDNDSIAENLCAGTYSVEVTDLNGCVDTSTVIIESPDSIDVTDNTTQPLCNGDANGEVIITVSGGVAPYSIDWYTAGNQTNDTITGLTAGSYFVEITDNNGCLDTTEIVVSEPALLSATITDSTNILCNGASTGTVEVTAVGGTTPYSYNWYNVPGSPTTPTVSNLPAGIYNVEVTDSNGCIDTAQVTLTQPEPLSYRTDSIQATCSGLCDGSVIIAVDSGGTGPYTFDWYTAGNNTNDTVSGLCLGTYSVEITDSVGCIDTVSVSVTEVVSITTSLDTMIPATCPNGNDAIAAISGSGGTLPYTYWWSDPLNQTNDTATGLTAQVYQAAVIDSNGCSDTLIVNVTEPAPIQLNETINNVSCKDVCDGSIITLASGGTGPYSHSWSTGSTLPSIGTLCDGVYTDTITDNAGCRDTFSITITEPDSLIPIADGTNLLCNGDASGSVFVNTNGGTMPYTYVWDDAGSSTTDSVVGLNAGTYIVEVTDSNNCVNRDTVSISEPLVLAGTISDTIHANCVCNGEATVTPAGGTAPYSYSWSDIGNQTDSIAIGLCAGDYEVIVTDTNNCMDTVPVTIRDTSAFTIFFTDTILPTCFGDCDGGATVTPDSGIAPYTFLWTDLAATTDSTVSNLCAGNYFVTVTDSIGCVRNLNLNLSQPAPVTGTPDFQQPLCFGDTNGIAWVVPSGGTGPYTHSWSTGSTNDSIFNIGAGIYTDTVTDANGCQDTIAVTVTEPTLLTVNPTGRDISCFGAADGQVYSGASGGTTPYNFLWNDVANSTTDTVTGIDPGVYTIFLQDVNGCSDTDSVAITQPLPLISSIVDSSNVNCMCTGTATVGATGGTTPYSFAWNDITNQTDTTAINLCAGNYQVIVTDSNSCSDTSFVVIEDTSSFVAGLVDTTMASCYGLCNGTAIAFADSGATPYSFVYNDPSNTTDSIVSGLCAGNYFVTISDSLGCTRNVPFTITEPDSIDVTIPNAMASCFDSCDAQLVATVSGGTAPYSYLWNDPSNQTTDTATGLCAGIYQLIVEDSLNCLDTMIAQVNQPAQLIALIQTQNNVTCNGEDDGLLAATQLGGTAPYTYLWNTTETTASIDSLSPGLYTITITDTNGCVADTNATIIEPDQLVATMIDSVNVLCNGDSTGRAEVSAAGGTAPYTYSWYDSPNNGTDSIETNLPAGTYNVQVTDANGCADTAQVTITEPANPLTINLISNTATSCLVCDGELQVSGQDGTGPYRYRWLNIAGNPTDSIVNGLCAQSYTVEVTDTNGCITTQSFNITGPGGLAVQVFDSTAASCFGVCDGEAIAAAIGGDAPYTFSWDDPSNTMNDTVQNLCAGAYEVTLSDSNGCLAYAQVSIAEPAQLVASITDTSSSGCIAPCNGDATVGVIGGNGGYAYSWNDPSSQTTAIATGLCAGAYIVEVTDSLGCSDTAVANIAGPNLFIVQVDSVRDATCNGVCDGYASVAASGGAGNYSYLWNDPLNTTTPAASGLCAGDYTVTITDDNGCEAFAYITINEPTQLVVSITDSTDLTCNSDNSGRAVASYSGGTAPYTVLWNDGLTQSTDTAFNLSAGTYIVTITDNNGCSETAQVTINEPNVISTSLVNKTDVTCSGFCTGEATISTSGGTGILAVSWIPSGDNGLTADSLCTGWHTYTVTDDNGCTLIDSIEIVDLNALTVNVTGSNVSCNGVCDGAATALVSGGVGPYNHNWNTGAAGNNITGLCPGVYIDTVTDFNGCFVIDSVEITEPSTLLAVINDSNNLSCNSVCDGAATVSVSGGTLPYLYDWTNAPGNPTDSTANNLCAGSYFVEVTDSNNCIARDTVILTEPASITISVDNITNTTCFGDCDGEIQVSANGGSGALVYDWDNGDNGQVINGLCANRYLLTVTDDSLCTDTTSIQITQPNQLIATIIDTTHIVCSGLPQGAAEVGVTGGTTPYSYQWDDPSSSTSSTISNVVAGDYQVIVTDSAGCADTADVTINEDNVLSVAINRTDVSCNGECDGILEAIVTGGVAPYDIDWNNGPTTAINNGLCPAFYNVTVEDDDGCSVASAEQITQPTVLDVTIASSVDPTCNGSCNGQATAAASGGTAPYTYLWNDPLNQNSSNASGLCAQTYQVLATDNNGCEDSVTVSLSEPTAITTITSSVDATCSNTNDGQANVIAAGGTAPYNYSWFNNGGYLNNAQNPSNMGVGRYYITVSDDNGCSELDSVTINEQFFVIADAGADRVICLGDTVNLTANGGITYEWSNGTTNANTSVQPTSTTNYFVIAYNNICSDTDSVSITVNPVPDAVVTTSANIILEGTTAQLQASGGGNNETYSWNPPIGLNDPTLSNPIADPEISTNYIVTVENEFGCADTAHVRIRVEETIIFPDGITPNSDGFNDDWRILLIEEFPNARVEVYNRWGQRVFESVGYNDRWDGTRNGNPLPVGTYYYVIDLGNGLPKYTGPITLMR
jgi:gliding motility-associated-like protein